MKIHHGQYTSIDYRQFRSGHWFRLIRLIAAVCTWPVIWPIAMLSRTSDDIFRTVSELLSLIPIPFGVIIRSEFYRFALKRCGKNIVVGLGTIFLYRDISMGNNILIGPYNTIHHCDFGNYVLTAEGCSFLSGSRYHNFDRTDIPMALQGGYKKRISVGNDCWIGTRAVVMENVGRGAVVGAGSVVTKPVDDFTIVAGNPAKPLRKRTIDEDCRRQSFAPLSTLST